MGDKITPKLDKLKNTNASTFKVKMNLLNQALVVAHFHHDGRLRTDTLSFLESCRGKFKRLIFISTNLSAEQRLLMPDFVECLVRENIGYDFLSYKIGIARLIEDSVSRDSLGKSFERVTLMNTSFIICDVNKFINAYFYADSSKVDVDFFGLTTHESDGVVPPHLQSFLISFNRKVLSDEDFISWWAEVKNQNDKKTIIQNYEIGLSVYLNKMGYEMDSIYQLPSSKIILDPMHGNFLEILDQFGVLKIGLFKVNPFRLNLDPLILRAQLDEKFRLALAEGMEN